VNTVGVDLSAQPKETAACLLHWDDSCCRVARLAVGLDNDALLDLIETASPKKVAVDAPFGWPIPFVEAVSGYAASGHWPAPEETRRPLLLRTTDLAVLATAGGRPPLSVSADKIAVCAMRCAELLNALACDGAIDRTGGGLAIEVYPAAALRQWGLDAARYKGNKPEQQQKRHELIGTIAEATSEWLELNAQERALLVASDHLLDALVSAVLARAAAIGVTLPIPDDVRPVAAIEGWIHLPRRQPLSEFELFIRR
jgi:predicted RNase H-like nuclease